MAEKRWSNPGWSRQLHNTPSRARRRTSGTPSATAAQSGVYVIDHAADGDTVTLRNAQRVRLVQIDTPEVYFGTEC